MPLDSRAGFETFWTRDGAGERDALLLHCTLSHSGEWKRLKSFLGAGYRYTAFDLPGHGRSANWDRRGDLHDVSTAIARSLLDGPTDIIGHSFGGTVALRLAEECPEMVRSVTLIEPVLFAAARGTAAFDADVDLGRQIAAAMERNDRETAARLFTEAWGAGQSWDAVPEDQRRYATERMDIFADTVPAVFDDAPGLLAEGRLEGVEAPVLLLEGSRTRPVIGVIQQRLAERLPHARRVIVSGAGHMLPVTHAQACAREIGEFLQAVG